MRADTARMTLQNADPGWFWVLLLIAAVAFLAFTYLDIYRRSGRKLAWILFTARALAVLLLLAALVKPALRQVTEKRELPQLALIVDDSQSMSLAQPAGVGELTPRYRQASGWLRDSEAARKLRQDFTVRLFDSGGRELDRGALPEEPNAEQTDLVRAMRSAEQRLRGSHSAGVLLISDGRDTSGRRDFAVLQEYSLPVFALGFPRTERGSGGKFDLEVVSVDAPERALLHNTVPVKVVVSKDGVMVSTVNEVLCKGCGTCSVVCPTGAMSTRHFTREQILEQVGALTEG